MQQIVLSSRQFSIHWIRTTKRCPVTKQLALICAMGTAVNPLHNHRDSNFQCHIKQIPWNGSPEISHSEAHRLEYKTETSTKTQTDKLIAMVLARKKTKTTPSFCEHFVHWSGVFGILHDFSWVSQEFRNSSLTLDNVHLKILEFPNKCHWAKKSKNLPRWFCCTKGASYDSTLWSLGNSNDK